MKAFGLALFLAIPMTGLCAEIWNPEHEDIVNCRWIRTGEPLGDGLCNELRADAEGQKERERQRAEIRERQRRSDEAKAELDRRQEEVRAENRKREQAEKDARVEATRRELNAYERRERAEAKAYATKQQALKGKCGADYHQPKIGMTLVRAQECVATFSMSSQLKRADGVVSTYSGGGMYLHVMDGKVIAWGRN